MELTIINDENSVAFADYLPAGLLDEIHGEDSIAIGAVDDNGCAAGIVAASVIESWVNINWIYVNENFREQGLARRLIENLSSASFENPNIFGVTTAFEADRLPIVYNLFKRLNFSMRQEKSSIYTTTIGEIRSNHFWKEKAASGANLPIGEVPKFTLSTFEKKLELLDIALPVDNPITWEAFEKSCSIGYIRDRDLKGVLLLSHDAEGLEISFVYADPGEKSALGLMLRASGFLAGEKYAQDTRVIFSAVNEITAEIFKKLFPDSKDTLLNRAVFNFNR